MQYRIKEGMHVFGTDGKKVGEVAKVVVGGATREPRFFVVEKGMLFHKDYLVPREAIVRVDDKGAHLSLPKDRIERLPEYRDEAPTRDEVDRAYQVLGGRRSGDRIEMDRAPFLGTGGQGTSGMGAGTTSPYIVTYEEYLVLTPEERSGRGFRDEWDYSGGTGETSRR